MYLGNSVSKPVLMRFKKLPWYSVVISSKSDDVSEAMVVVDLSPFINSENEFLVLILFPA